MPNEVRLQPPLFKAILGHLQLALNHPALLIPASNNFRAFLMTPSPGFVALPHRVQLLE